MSGWRRIAVHHAEGPRGRSLNTGPLTTPVPNNVIPRISGGATACRRKDTRPAWTGRLGIETRRDRTAGSGGVAFQKSLHVGRDFRRKVGHYPLKQTLDFPQADARGPLRVIRMGAREIFDSLLPCGPD